MQSLAVRRVAEECDCPRMYARVRVTAVGETAVADGEDDWRDCEWESAGDVEHAEVLCQVALIWQGARPS